MIAKEEFLKLFAGSFWKKITEETLVPYPQVCKPKKQPTLEKLYDDITQKRFYPELPREYVVSDKHNRVSRIIPVFEARENCVYYFCVKQLEGHIAVNRVDGTFGGWTLGNPIREKEDGELQQLTPPSPIPSNSYNPFRWSKNWKEFQKRAYLYSQKGQFSFFLKFDIANFYDTINLSILEDKIRLVTTKQEALAIELLFHLLRNWNRRFERYSLKSVGIPQDETGDCSRILANFYLQDYDAVIKAECDKHNACCLSYADDKIIMAKSEDDARGILFEASKELFKINLNINSSKVAEFPSHQDFYRYWAFEIFELFDEANDSDAINKGIEKYFKWLDQKIHFREESVLRRIVSIGLAVAKPHLKHRILAKLFEPQFLITQDYWLFDKVAQFLPDCSEFFKTLDEQICRVRFNSYHYNLLKFYKKWRKSGFPEQEIIKRISELSLRMY
jgi:hypothetical protein